MRQETLHKVLAIGKGTIEMVEDHNAGAFRVPLAGKSVCDLFPQDAQATSGMRGDPQPLAQSLECVRCGKRRQIHKDVRDMRGRGLIDEHPQHGRLACAFRADYKATPQAGFDKVLEPGERFVMTCAGEKIEARVKRRKGSAASTAAACRHGSLPARPLILRC
jgi:hypothetical protein